MPPSAVPSLGKALGVVLHFNVHIVSQVGVTSLLVQVSKDTRHYAADRILETVLGPAIVLPRQKVIELWWRNLP